MIKNILNIERVHKLSRNQQVSILGGIDKCCIRGVPKNGYNRSSEPWCNSRPECSSSSCAC